MKKWLSFSLRLLVGLLILSLLFWRIGFEKVAETIGKIPAQFIFFFILLNIFNIITGTINIKVLLNPIKRVGFLKLVKYYVYSWSIGLFVPGKIGEFSLVLFLEKEGISAGESGAAALMDKLITVFCMALFSLAGFFMFFERRTAIGYTAILAAGFAAVVFAVFSKRLREFAKRHIPVLKSERLKGFSKTALEYVKHKKSLLFIDFAITLFKFIAYAWFTWLFILAMGESVTLFNTAIVMAAGTILSIIPISLSGLGVRESASIYLFSLAGVKPEVSGAIMLFYLIGSYVIAAGFFALYKLAE
jgi:glycosyltransferase 2 family protein